MQKKFVGIEKCSIFALAIKERGLSNVANGSVVQFG